MTTTLTSTQQTTIHVNAITDRRGHPAPIDGTPKWECSDLTILTITPSADGMSCLVVTTGTLGSASVTTDVDADLGEGVRTVQHAEFFSVIDAPASNIDVTIDSPSEVDGTVNVAPGPVQDEPVNPATA